MDYKIKYMKYKQKYISLKQQFGGNEEFKTALRTLFDKHFDKFFRCELTRIFFGDKFITERLDIINTTNTTNIVKEAEIKENFMQEENFEHVYTKLLKMCEYIYKEVEPTDDKYIIFSYATGNGFFEAIYALYLKNVVNKKLVYMVFYDTTPKDEEIENYGVFDKILNLHNIFESNNELFKTRLMLFINPDKETLRKAMRETYYNDFNVSEFNRLDCYISINPNYSFSTLNAAKNYINFIAYISKQELNKIPLITIFCTHKLNTSTENEFIESIQQEYDNTIYDSQLRKPYAWSTLDNLELLINPHQQ